MNWIHALVLGLLQGATEFLPVSSSGHLVLVPWILNWPDRSLAFYTLLHFGTALAVVSYFWRDWVRIIGAAWIGIRERSLANPDARLAFLILLAGLPGGLAGILLDDFFERMFSRPVAAAGFLLVTAAFMALAETFSRPQRGLHSMSWIDSLTVGLAQALAILPGISRSGSTIATGMARGLNRESSARFSFLLATPTILGAGLLELPGFLQAGGLLRQAPDLFAGFLAALTAGLVCIHLLLRHLQRRTLYPFAIYCGLAGVLGLALALVRG